MTAIGKITDWFRRQIGEIRDDRVLRYYGVALAALNVVTFLHWTVRHDITKIISRDVPPVCWPFFENCHAYRFLSAWDVGFVMWAYLGLSVAAGYFFLRRERVEWGYWLLLAVNAVRVLVLMQDFRLRLNQHYMANWIALAFLLFPYKRVLIPHLLVLFYFWAGVLKLDTEWLTGAALYHRDKLWVPEALVPASCVYVVVLELVVIFGLYSRRAWIFWGTVAQLVTFHAFSWPIVGFYYPLLMGCLVSIFLLAWMLDRRAGTEPPSGLGRPELRVPAAVLLGSFAFFQLIPYAFPGDSAITGEGRLFALNMFDALVVCDGKATIHGTDGSSKVIPLNLRNYPRRIACDPIVYLNLARNECRRMAGNRRVRDFDLELKSRRSSDSEFQKVIEIGDFCSQDLEYDMWRPNPWILK